MRFTGRPTYVHVINDDASSIAPIIINRFAASILGIVKIYWNRSNVQENLFRETHRIRYLDFLIWRIIFLCGSHLYGGAQIERMLLYKNRRIKSP